MADLQCGALPWRKVKGGIEILLVTTRNTRRWIVPKGWPTPKYPASASAADEAFEEAGVTGKMSDTTIGAFRHRKQLKSGAFVSCDVIVFALEVKRRSGKWPEKGDRDTRWCSPEEAMLMVIEPGLRKLIATFAKSRKTAKAKAKPKAKRKAKK